MESVERRSGWFSNHQAPTPPHTANSNKITTNAHSPSLAADRTLPNVLDRGSVQIRRNMDAP